MKNVSFQNTNNNKFVNKKSVFICIIDQKVLKNFGYINICASTYLPSKYLV